MNFHYITARIIRRLIPRTVTDFLRNRSIIFHPGIETSDPEYACSRYLSALEAHGWGFKQKTVTVFGYGGSYGLAAELLNAGARHVGLIDLHERTNPRSNKNTYLKYAEYFNLSGSDVEPKTEYISLSHGNILNDNIDLPSADILLSSSVLEHVDQLDKVVKALKLLTKTDGIQLHRIDLGDHFRKYPFEMLTYSSFVWNNFLNPPSNLNRLRIDDYKESFEKFYTDTKITIEGGDPEKFHKVREKIKPKFLTGSDERDSVLGITLFAAGSKLRNEPDSQ
ncbi:MAG: hypothetical protein IID12_09955 [Candidatus Marinimicrobia bacterium]|nr:hypothetical protein [Candidatus Neomarinimicrobiota bacterium]